MTLALWVVLGLLAAMAVLAWWQPWPQRELVALTGIAPTAYFLAWPALLVAAIYKEWPAAALAGVLIVSHLAYTLPTMHPWRTAAPADGDWRLRIYSHNVLFTNVDLAGVAAQIERHSPDVVAIVELSEANVASLRDSAALAEYRYDATLPHEAGRGLGVWSRLPLTDIDFWQAPGYRQLQATVRPPDQAPVSLIVVHAEAPVSRERARTWTADMQAIASRAKAARRPVVVVGDFNATSTMRQFRGPIRAAGLIDAATTTGNGWRRTWPAYRLLPHVMRIDHALHSPDLTATSYQLGAGAGSDHRPLIVTLAHPLLRRLPTNCAKPV